MLEKKKRQGSIVSICDFEAESAAIDEFKLLHLKLKANHTYDLSDDCKQPFILSEKDTQKYLERIKLKDAGYSWVVLFAMVLSNVLTAGYVKTLGIMYNNILIEYPDTSEVMAGVLLGLHAGSRAILAPFASVVATSIGVRKATTIGATLCFVGLTTSCFCTSVLQLSVTLGAIMGCGFCIIETSQVIVISNYFDEKLSFANGVRVAGNPLGGVVYPFLLLYLFNTFGANMMRIVLAGLFLNLMVCVALIRPPDVHRRIQILDSLRDVQNEEWVDQDPKLKNEENRKIYQFLNKSLSTEGKTKPKRGLEFHYLKNCVYWIFVLVAISTSFAMPICIYYVPIYAREIGLTNYEISFLLTFISILDLCLRISMGYIADNICCKKLHCFMLFLTVGGIGAVTIPFCSNLLGLMFTMALYCVGSAGYFSLINVILIEQFGRNSIATTYGFQRMVQGIFSFINPPLIGALVDYTGSFTAAFVVNGLGMFTAAGLSFIEPVVVKVTKSEVVIT